MNLSMNRAEAVAAMAKINSVVLRRTTIPILQHVVLHANGALIFRATDLDRQAIVRIACEATDESEVTVPAAALHDALRQSSAETAELAMDGNRMGVKLGRARFKLPTLPARDYPQIPDEGLAPWGEIAAADLLALIDATLHAASKDASRWSVMGLRLFSEDGQVCAVATDMKQMAIHRVASEAQISPSVTVPTPSLEALKRLVPEAGTIRLSGSDGLVRFAGDGWDLIAKVISDPFPEYQRALAFPVVASFTTDPDDLLAAARRAMVVAQDSSRSLRFDLSSGSLEVSAAHAEAESSEPLEVDYEGEDRSFGLPADKLISAIDAVNADAIRFDLTDFSLGLRPTDRPTPHCLISLFRTN